MPELCGKEKLNGISELRAAAQLTREVACVEAMVVSRSTKILQLAAVIPLVVRKP
jgi:hypothetical protein